MVEGIRRKKVKIYSFYYLKLCVKDWWNQFVQYIRPFLTIDYGLYNSHVLLGRPTLKDLKVSINNSNDS
jgi:hypothetical protein